MTKLRNFLRGVTVSAIVASITFGIALGVTNVLVNHVHWIGAYLIACPDRHWGDDAPPVSHPASAHGARRG